MRFHAAYEECKEAVYGYLYYMTKDVQLAEDLSQETFLKIYLNIGKYKEKSSVKTWALKIAHNVFCTYARKKQPILLEEQSFDVIPSIEYQPESNVIHKEEEVLIRNIMLSLREQERTILLLRDYEDLKYEEIAQLLNLSIDVVKVRIHRARQKFQKYYIAATQSQNL